MTKVDDTQSLKNKIHDLAKEKNALILAHNYQPGEIQEIAHVSGDSLELAKIAADNKADIIVFCGVHFMAESAAMLSPEKKVLLPVIDAGCPMADTATAEKLIEKQKEHPTAKVVTYINSSAAVKAESDIICTSSNAVNIIQKIDSDEILFVPDKNLAHYVQRFTDKKVIPWEGACPIHDNFTKEKLEAIKSEHEDGFVIVHPECIPEVIELADKVLSTGHMVKFVQETDVKKIIVATEEGMIHKLKSVAPHIEYIKAASDFICPDMKKITPEILHNAILEEKEHIKVEEGIRIKAVKALEAMLALS